MAIGYSDIDQTCSNILRLSCENFLFHATACRVDVSLMGCIFSSAEKTSCVMSLARGRWTLMEVRKFDDTFYGTKICRWGVDVHPVYVVSRPRPYIFTQAIVDDYGTCDSALLIPCSGCGMARICWLRVAACS